MVSDILAALRDAVRRYIPQDQVQDCECAWEDDNAGILCWSVFWEPAELRVVQDFLDELNEILKPIMNECDGICIGEWYIKEPPFAIATWDWTEGGFNITGTVL